MMYSSNGDKKDLKGHPFGEVIQFAAEQNMKEIKDKQMVIDQALKNYQSK